MMQSYYYTTYKNSPNATDTSSDNYFEDYYLHKTRFNELLSKLDKQDHLIVSNLSDLGISLKIQYKNLVKLYEITPSLRILKPKINPDNIETLLGVLNHILQKEDELASEIVKNNIIATSTLNNDKKVVLYKPKSFQPCPKWENTYKLFRQGALTATDCGKVLGMSRATFFRYVKLYEQKMLKPTDFLIPVKEWFDDII